MRTILFSIAIGFVVTGCALDEGDVDEQDEKAIDQAGVANLGDEPTASAARSCASGWHEHYVDWPSVGRRNGPCWPVIGTITQGRHVCMLNRNAIPCQGQGYSQVYLLETEGPDNWTWARTEAFNGH